MEEEEDPEADNMIATIEEEENTVTNMTEEIIIELAAPIHEVEAMIGKEVIDIDIGIKALTGEVLIVDMIEENAIPHHIQDDY